MSVIACKSISVSYLEKVEKKQILIPLSLNSLIFILSIISLIGSSTNLFASLNSIGNPISFALLVSSTVVIALIIFLLAKKKHVHIKQNIEILKGTPEKNWNHLNDPLPTLFSCLEPRDIYTLSMTSRFFWHASKDPKNWQSRYPLCVRQGNSKLWELDSRIEALLGGKFKNELFLIPEKQSVIFIKKINSDIIVGLLSGKIFKWKTHNNTLVYFESSSDYIGVTQIIDYKNYLILFSEQIPGCMVRYTKKSSKLYQVECTDWPEKVIPTAVTQFNHALILGLRNGHVLVYRENISFYLETPQRIAIECLTVFERGFICGHRNGAISLFQETGNPLVFAPAQSFNIDSFQPGSIIYLGIYNNILISIFQNRNISQESLIDMWDITTKEKLYRESIYTGLPHGLGPENICLERGILFISAYYGKGFGVGGNVGFNHVVVYSILQKKIIKIMPSHKKFSALYFKNSSLFLGSSSSFRQPVPTFVERWDFSL